MEKLLKRTLLFFFLLLMLSAKAAIANAPDPGYPYSSERETWQQQVVILREKAQSDPRGAKFNALADFLEQMLVEADADIDELAQVEEKLSVDVQARLRARFQMMDREYQRTIAE